jgi:hypothetical protein
MLYTINRFHVPGVIEATRGDVSKRVHVRAGYVVHASSTDRDDSLGSYLRKIEAVSEKELDEVILEREITNKKLGVLLVEKSLLPPAQAYRAIREQIEAIVWSLFYWNDGQVTYGLEELVQEDLIQIQLPIGRVIVEGIRRAPDVKPLMSRIGSKETRFEPCYRAEDLIEIGLAEDEFKLLQMVDGEKTLYHLCSKGPKMPSENAKLLYAFQVLQLIKQPQVVEESEQAAETESTDDGPVKVRFETSGDEF